MAGVAVPTRTATVRPTSLTADTFAAMLAPGDKAPELDLLDQHGIHLTLKSLKGRTIPDDDA